MNRVVLILTALLFFCGAVAAQQKSPDAPRDLSSGAGLLQKAISLDANAEDDSFAANLSAELTAAAPPMPSRPRGKLPMPSNVGYIDDAIIGSQVRIRFDAGFHDSSPDRAEFFYPQCACTNVVGAPGPNFPGASININFQQIYLQAEYAPVSRFSIFTEVPFRWIKPQPNSFIAGSFDPNATPPEIPSTQTNSGVSDVRAGIKAAIASSSNHSLTLQLRAYFPTGNGSLGLGTDHYSIEPSLLYYQRLSQRWAVESQLGDWHPIGGSRGEVVGTQTLTNFAGDVFFYGIGPSYQLVDGEHAKFAPVVELFGWHVVGGLQTPPTPFPSNSICTKTGVDGCSIDAAGTNIVNLKIGARTSIGNRNSIYVGYGRALTGADWYRDIVRIEYRHLF